MPATTADTAATLLSATRALASRCDGAVEQDGVGFNGQDTKFGRRIAEFATEADLVRDPALAAEVYRMLTTYRVQLRGLGFDNLPKPAVEADATVHEAREAARRMERAVKNRPLVTLEGQSLRVSRSFDIKESLKQAGARFNSQGKTWDVPVANAALLREVIKRDGLSVTLGEGVEALLAGAKAPKKAERPEQQKREITVKDDTATISFPYDAAVVAAVRDLPGRKWNGVSKVWTAPVTPALFSFANDHAFVLPTDLAEQEAERVNMAQANLDQSRALAGDADVAISDHLYPFQKAGVEYAVRTRRALIGDEMGLGKTRQAISALETADCFPAIIVCPASLKINWEREFNALLPGRTTQVVQGKKPHSVEADVIIVNYDVLDAWEEFLPDPVGLVFDESHYVKNPKALRTLAAHRLAARVP